MRIAIFGATGKIGQYLADYILNHDESIEIVAVGYRKQNVFASSRVNYYSINVENAKELLQLPDFIDVVVDLAGAVTTRVRSDDVKTYVGSNISGAVNIFDYAVRSGASRIVYAQTYNDVYGNGDIVIRPDSIRKQIYRGEAALYAITKNAAVDLLFFYQEHYGIIPFVLRLPTVYCYTPSPHYMVRGKMLIRPFRKWIQSALDATTIEIWGNPQHFMDMVYIKDCCQMFYAAVIANTNGGIYNVGTGIGTTLQQQVEGIIEVFSTPGRESQIVYRPEMPNGRPFIMDIESAKRELGYAPQYYYIELLKDFKREMQIAGVID